MPRKRQSAGQTIGGVVAGIEQQIFRTTPPANELVAKGTPLRSVAAAGGGTITVGMPDDPAGSGADAGGGDDVRGETPTDSVDIDPAER